MAGNRGVMVVSDDTIIDGEVRNGQHVEIYGQVQGTVAADALVVRRGGRMYGTLRADSAEVEGDLQGNVFVKKLITIRSSGSVSGNVQYGQLAMEEGGHLSAEVRNIPPRLVGDLDVTVDRGRSVKITIEDINAIDPDDDAKDLVFTVTHPTNGFISLAAAPSARIATFTQADLQTGSVLFVHDGGDTGRASFDVVVADHAGATSGAPQTVKVTVRG